MSAIEYLPTQLSLTTIAEAMQSCEGCALCRRAIQAVPGEGARATFVVELERVAARLRELEHRDRAQPMA